MTPAFLSFGFAELLVIAVVALLVFGGRLPEVMHALGRSYGRLRDALQELGRPVRDEVRGLTRLPDSPPVARSERVPDYPAEGEEAGGGPPGEEGDRSTARAPAPPPAGDLDIDEPPPV